MPTITIRPVRGEELLEATLLLASYAFFPTPPLASLEARRERVTEFDSKTNRVLFEDERPVAAITSTPMTQNVRGQIYPMGALGDVVTLPESRRKGYARQLFTAIMDTMPAEGVVFSGLYPFRPSFYERLGYVSFPYMRIVSFSPAVLQPLLDWNLGGQVERMLIADGFDTYRAFARRCQPNVHGMALFADAVAQHRQKKRNQEWLALARFEDEVVGALLYRLTDFRDRMQVSHFLYHTNRGKYLLLEWFARHIDQVNTIELWLPHSECPETWLPDLQPQLRLPEFDYDAMGRIVDVARIGGMATGPGCFSAQINDPFCPWNTGRYRFETVDGVLQVSQTKTADCELTIQGLSALVYGTHALGDFTFLGWGHLSPELQATLRTMFPPMQPYLYEQY